MTSSLLLLMLVMAAIVLATMFNGPPTYHLRHRFGTKLKMSNNDHHRSSSCPSQFTSLYIANLDAAVSDEMLIQMFTGFGKSTRLVLAKDFKGDSRGFAFIEFESADSARQAVIHMNGMLKVRRFYTLRGHQQLKKVKTYNNLTWSIALGGYILFFVIEIFISKCCPSF